MIRRWQRHPVPPVDDRDVDIRTFQATNRFQTAKTGTHHDHLVRRPLHHSRVVTLT